MNRVAAEKILLLPMCGFGDAVCYLPCLHALRSSYPHARIVCLVISEPARLILESSNTGVEVIVFNRGGRERGWRPLLAVIRRLRSIKFDVVLSGAHPDSPRVPVFACLSGAKLRIGAAAERLSFLYHRRLNIDTAAHAYQRFSMLLQGLGLTLDQASYTPVIQPPLHSQTEASQLWTDAGLDDSSLVVGLISGADTNARGRWKPYLKRWAPERYAAVAKWITEEAGAKVVIFGGPEEHSLGEDIASRAGVPMVNFCGKTAVSVLPWLFSKCSVLLTNDTGLMHLAAAVGRPVVALFGPTSHLAFGPAGNQHVMIQGTAPCAPCYPHPTCDLTGCRAMEDISAEQVKSSLARVVSACLAER